MTMQPQSIDPNGVLFNPDTGILLVGITLFIPGQFNSRAAVEFIQDNHYDDLGASGYFRLMPVSHIEHASWEYVDKYDTLQSLNIPEEVLAQYDAKTGLTSVSLLLGQCDLGDDATEELEAIAAELALFHSSYDVRWEQFPLNIAF